MFVQLYTLTIMLLKVPTWLPTRVYHTLTSHDLSYWMSILGIDVLSN